MTTTSEYNGPVHAAAGPPKYRVTFDAKHKLILPPAPAYNDPPGLCAWLDCAFNIDRGYPIVGGLRQGLRGPEGHVLLTRAGAQGFRFEPAGRINNPGKLIETLTWQKIPSDGAIHALQGSHCREISDVIVKLCGLHQAMTEAQEAEGIVGTLMAGATEAEGKFTTYGPSTEKYKAARALHRLRDANGGIAGPPQYLQDLNTGEIVIAVSDLQEAARRHIGSTIPHGWLDGRMAAADWERITIEGHAEAGRGGLNSAHARIGAFRGLLRTTDA